MTAPTKKSEFNRKILAAIIIVIVAIASASAAAAYVVSQSPKRSSNTNLPSMSLTIVGADGQRKVLNQTDIAAMQSCTGKGGLKKSCGLISQPSNYTGVRVTEFLNSGGGMINDQALHVTASDGYSMVFTYNQVVNGQDFTTFDPVTGSQVNATQPLELVLAYYVNGTLLPSGEGPLRLVILGPEGLLTEGHLWVKLITGLQVVLNATPAAWSVIINGTVAITMPESSFANQVSQNTATYNDSVTTWSGTPLAQLVTWAENNGAISNSALTAGYVVKVIGSDGCSQAFNDSRVSTSNIIVANTANGSALAGSYAPLTLAGSSLANKEKVKEIAQIQILPIQHCSITIVAANGTGVTLYSNDLAMMSSITYNGGTLKSGSIINNGSYTGVKLSDLCNLVGGIISSNTIKVKGSDGYTVLYTYGQVINGTGFTTYDSSGNSATPTQPLYLILAYWYNGANIPTQAAGGSGPLKTMVVGANGLNTPGNIAAKCVVEIDIS
jgi:hypothetical protein